MPPFVRIFYFVLDLLYLGLMLNEPRRARRGGQNVNFIHFIPLLCHPFGVVDFISPSSRGYASLHHLPVVVPALRASLHNQLPYKINYSFVRQFYFRNLNFYIPYRRFIKDGARPAPTLSHQAILYVHGVNDIGKAHQNLRPLYNPLSDEKGGFL